MRYLPEHIGWDGIFRLGLVQTALGAIIVLTTSMLNRVMVVEMALPAIVPGILVGLHHVVQLLRPRLGHGSDGGGRRTPWIIGGMATLALGGLLAALATALMVRHPALGIALGVVAFIAIGIGVGAAGTSLLVLLAKRVHPARRAAAATIAWVMMIAGFILTSAIAGHFLDPFSPTRMVGVVATACVIAFLLACVAVHGVEGGSPSGRDAAAGTPDRSEKYMPFRVALNQVWRDTSARRFTVFVFVSMLAYSMQDLILEPFAGLVFGYTPGESTRLAGFQNGGVLLGMLLVGCAGTVLGRRGKDLLSSMIVAGCIASAVALLGLVAGALLPHIWPLRPTVFLLGLANGAFAVSAIGSMMALAGAGKDAREGVRMGLWGAAQAIAFAVGGLVGTASVDALRWLFGAPAVAYAAVFALEAGLFVMATWLAVRVSAPEAVESDEIEWGDPMTYAAKAFEP